ncbi:hypothetical protein IJ843_02790, partial [bacterium]|nr:hypothetical protein [bacterium]
MDLRVSNVSFTAVKNTTAQNRVQKAPASGMTSPLAPAKNDVFEKKPFNVDEAVESLGNMIETRNGRTNPKFDGFQLRTIQAQLTQEPKKWDSINTLAKKPHLRGSDVVRLSRNKVDRLDVVTEYANAVDYKQKPRYGATQLFTLAENNVETEKLKNALPLSKTSLQPKNILALANGKSSEFLNKAANVVAEFETDVLKNDVDQIVFNRDASDKNAYNVMAKNHKNEIHSVLLDKNLNKEAVESLTLYRSKGKTYEIKKANDLRNHTTSKVRMELDSSNYPVVTHEVRVIKDKNNKVLKTEYTSPSEVPG